jgi:hypothetical protein
MAAKVIKNVRMCKCADVKLMLRIRCADEGMCGYENVEMCAFEKNVRMC